jgi:hypothetical protein
MHGCRSLSLNNCILIAAQVITLLSDVCSAEPNSISDITASKLVSYCSPFTFPFAAYCANLCFRMSSFFQRFPIRWRKIGLVHVAAAVAILSSLRYVQFQHAKKQEEERMMGQARRRQVREERDATEAAAQMTSSSSPSAQPPTKSS